MGLLDKIKDMLSGNVDKAKGGVAKAGDMIDERPAASSPTRST